MKTTDGSLLFNKLNLCNFIIHIFRDLEYFNGVTSKSKRGPVERGAEPLTVNTRGLPVYAGAYFTRAIVMAAASCRTVIGLYQIESEQGN